MNENFDLLRIFHQTVYRYSQPVKFLPHRLVLRPREGHDLRVESLALATIPRGEIAWSRDIFGNSIAQAYFSDASEELRIESDVTIRRATPSVVAPSSPSAVTIPYPLQYEPLEKAAVGAYLQLVYPEEAEPLQQWLRLQKLEEERTAEELVLHLTAAIHKLVRYQRREEKGVQSPATTLTLGQGSCRDLASLLMEAARHLGIATRFASGYLDCAATRAARGVTHAWTEVYFPGLGWRGFDPTVGKRCSHQHIVTGVSNHPRGVMPVSGKFLGGAGDFVEMTVLVEFSAVPASGTAASTI